jgi:hypothetical protein
MAEAARPSTVVPPKPAVDPVPWGYRVVETKKVNSQGGVFQFNAGKVLKMTAYGQAAIKALKGAGLKLEPLMSEPEL